MTPADRDLVQALMQEMQALRMSNADMHHIAGELAAKLDAMPQRLADQLIRMEDRVVSLEEKHGTRLEDHSQDLTDVITKVNGVQKTVWWVKAYSAGAGATATLFLAWIAFALWRIPPEAWAAFSRLGGKD